MVHIKEGKQPFDLNYNKLLWNWIEQKVFHNHKDKEKEAEAAAAAAAEDGDEDEGVNSQNVGDSIGDSDERNICYLWIDPSRTSNFHLIFKYKFDFLGKTEKK